MDNPKVIIGCIAAFILVTGISILFCPIIAVGLTVVATIAAVRYLPNVIGSGWTTALVTIAIALLLYSVTCWWTERNLPFATQMRPFGIQSLDNTLASLINRPGVRGEQSLLKSTFRKEEQTNSAKIEEAFEEDPLEAARLLGQQQADGQVIRDMANPFKKPVDIAQYRLQRAEKDLRDRALIMQAVAKEAKAVQMKGTVTKEVVDKDGNIVFKVGDRVALASNKTDTKGAELTVLVYKGENEIFTGNGQTWSIPYSCVKFDPIEIEPEATKKETSRKNSAPTLLSSSNSSAWKLSSKESNDTATIPENIWVSFQSADEFFIVNRLGNEPTGKEIIEFKKMPAGASKLFFRLPGTLRLMGTKDQQEVTITL